MAVELSVLDLPRVQPVADPAACLQAAVHRHFRPETCSPYWLRPATMFDFDPLRVLSLHGQVVDSVSEVRPVQRFDRETAIERVH